MLGGVIAGRLIDPKSLWICAVAAVGPDIDFLWGRHSMETHSIGATAIVFGLAWLVTRDRRTAAALAAAWASHLLFDWLGSDTTPPLGIMALWPFTSDFYFAQAYIFESISRRYWLDNFVAHNVWAVIRELLILGPITYAVFVMSARWRGPRRSRRPGTT